MYKIRERNFPYKKKQVGKNLFEIRFKSHVNTYNKKNDIVYCLLRDSKTKEKICVLVHGLGTRTRSKWDEFIFYIPEEMGVCSIDLPYHRHRNTGKDLMTALRDGIFSLNFFKQGTRDIIRTVDLLKNMDYKDIYIMGVSLGSFFSLMAMGLDKRIQKGVFLLCGGDQSIITWKSPAMINVRKQHRKEGITRANCMKCRSFFQDFQQSVKNGHSPYEIKNIQWQSWEAMTNIQSPSWGPDGMKLAYLTGRRERTIHIFDTMESEIDASSHSIKECELR